MFDEKSRQALKYYVYMLLDPSDNKPFYVGKGIDNRVFNHLACALIDTDTSNTKYDKIREIVKNGQTVKHIIVRHGLSESEAFQIEASLIDTLTYCGLLLSNIVNGHNSIEKGLMTSEEIVRLYNAQPLSKMGSDCVLINKQNLQTW
ncbi:GIY-YIG nuclease family protein [Xiashengella succiniciproducens]|uniref:GIY-YIG nuclease family protein n=1 Tax=Xiashengella succiniciproducens TaxID=2949635 RepID=A0A9J6ZSN8_9BACT|nr:GIY-YIG nuclease family protein [Alkaliflexus sp. Ai-910]URW80956.1 GIY-YIG nuclease family protein [Alkaliflexus sp. Ai-910]